MAEKNKAMVFLFLCSVGIMVIPFIASCGKNTTAPSSANIQMQVVNLSPDLRPIDLYISNFKQNTTSFSYPNPSGYFSLKNIDSVLQIRSYSSLISSTNLVTVDTTLRANVKYTLFVTGLRADSSVTSIFTVDTAFTPTVGRGKIRFVNASPGSNPLDITANGSPAFSKQIYKKVSKFIEIPPGIYEFKIMPTGTTTVISDLTNVVVQDGKIYTIYCRGIANGADSVAFGAGIISNK